MRLIRRIILAAYVAIALIFSATPADAVILYKSPIRNKSAPTGVDANSGWQWQGHWGGGFEGTPIAPHYFITAGHVGGGVGQAIWVFNKNYTTTAVYDDPNTDLRIYKVADAFPSFAPLYTGTAESGKRAMVFGRGTGRGADVKVGTSLKGWQWATQDKVKSWGENTVAGTSDFGAGYGQLLRFTFDKAGLPNERSLSTGDSGGPVFIKDGTTWKLAGINYLVDGPFSKSYGGATFMASIYDKGGLYVSNNPISDTAADVPGNWYATRISRRANWIKSIIGTPPKGAVPTLAVSDTAAVPEPTGLALLASAATLLLRRRRSR